MNILFRCDCDQTTGTGHVLRCLGLAQELKDSGDNINFVVTKINDGIQSRLKREKFHIFNINEDKGSLADANETVKIAHNLKIDWIVTDGYHFVTGFQKIIKGFGFQLMCIDDIAGCRYVCDVVLNQNPGFSTDDYSTNNHTKVLLGPRFALLRREFRNAKIIERKEKDNVLVTLGGVDSHNLTEKIIDILEKIYRGNVTVLIGSVNPNIEKIKEKNYRKFLSFKIILDAKNVVGYMRNAKIAIHAAGITSWELAYLGIPSISFVLADNQEPIAKELEKAGFSFNMGWFNKFSEKKFLLAIEQMLNNSALFKKMVKAGKSLVDGKGAERVKRVLNK